ncbi:sialate O-acetylesterase [Candidatus Poribacteria bacterium]|nr:sialate O-acetylesterase [Candidatus Poribacteria bacterium]
MKLTIFVLIISMLFMTSASTFADVKLPHIFGNDMVMQRDMPAPIWGWAAEGEEITVSLSQQDNVEVIHTDTVKTDEKGDWRMTLPATPAGGPYTIKVVGSNTVEFTNILFGEVWVCSGQSNMAWTVNASNNNREEIATANYPNIRLFHIPRVSSGLPSTDVPAEWRPTSPDSVRHFSAVAYNFGRHIHKELDVPVGLISTSWGGTRIEAWTAPEGFDSVPALASITEEINDIDRNYRSELPKKIEEIKEWIAETRDALENDSVIFKMPENFHPLTPQGRPTALYNNMIYPLVPYAIRGALWYQGESNMREGMVYHEKMKALINGWREVWKQGDFPFYFVQLAPWGGYDRNDPTHLPKIWEAQTATLALPNTGMVVTTDIGNVKDIHPRNKQDVGLRLAYWALANTYGKDDIVYSGPLYKSMEVEGDAILISFKYTGSGLVSRDGEPLSWFQIAGEDQQFVDAVAVIDGDTVVVSSDTVKAPVAVRLGWNQIAEPNLMNKEGLPVSPFRTDSW